MKKRIINQTPYILGIVIPLIAILILGILTFDVRAQDENAPQIDPDSSPLTFFTDKLRQEVQRYGEIPVMIRLDVPAYDTWVADKGNLAQIDETDLNTMAAEISTVADNLLNRLAGQRISQVKRYDYFPLLAMIVDEATLEILAIDTSVTLISLDVPVPPVMNDTIPLTQANNNHFLNYTGSGRSIAILDTGADKNHPSLFGKVISEACYSSNVPTHGASSLCPGGASSSTATNSALPCPIGALAVATTGRM